MKLVATTTLSLVSLFALGQLASAGPLAKTSRAIDNKTSQSSRSGGSSSGSASTSPNNPRPEQRDSSHYQSTSHSHTQSTAHYTRSRCDGCSEPRLRIPAPDVELGLGGQKVRDSDGSFRLDARLLWGRVGIYAKGDHYFERISASEMPKAFMPDSSEYVRMNLFELAAMGRVVDSKNLQADVHAGLGVVSSSVFETLPGSALGLTLRARASEALSIRVEARAMNLRHNIRAYEGASGVQWKQLWLGYRALQFDVGQVLQGPEAGLRVKF